jgi:6-methylsalicylate decarboxylase
MRIDVHAHYRTEVQVLSASPQLPHFDDEAHATCAARFANDLSAEIVRRHPERFVAFAALPLPHVDAALTELERALDQLGMVGVTITTSILGRSPADPTFTPIYEELNRRGSVLYIHPAGCSATSPLIRDFHLTWMIGAPLEDTIAILHLITRGIPSRYPQLKIINAHLRGALPMVLQRLDNQYQWEAPQSPERPSLAARRMWYDTVGHGHVPALRCAADSLGADRLLLGTDFPYESEAVFQRAITYIQESGLTQGDINQILDRSAAKLLGFAATDAEPRRRLAR